MVDRCKKCGEKIVKFPLKDENGKWIIKNFFKMDMVSIFFLIAIVIMAYGYIHDTEECRYINENPCTYAAEVGCEGLIYSDGNFYDPNVNYDINESVEPEYIKWSD